MPKLTDAEQDTTWDRIFELLDYIPRIEAEVTRLVASVESKGYSASATEVCYAR